jgi:hypothetical protein
VLTQRKIKVEKILKKWWNNKRWFLNRHKIEDDFIIFLLEKGDCKTMLELAIGDMNKKKED